MTITFTGSSVRFHLYKAEYTDLFSRIFLNLNFVSVKNERAAGTSDLLSDLRKYQDYNDFISSSSGTVISLIDLID